MCDDGTLWFGEGGAVVSSLKLAALSSRTQGFHGAQCVYRACSGRVSACTCALSVSARRRLSVPARACGWAVPLCLDMNVKLASYPLVAALPPSYQCHLQGMEQAQERRLGGWQGGALPAAPAFVVSRPLHSLSPAHRHILAWVVGGGPIQAQ